MSYRIAFTRAALEDLERLYQFQIERDFGLAERAKLAIAKGLELLREFPFTCRKADPENPFLREILIPFGASGYVALFEIKDERTVTVLALRHQREEDYH